MSTLSTIDATNPGIAEELEALREENAYLHRRLEDARTVLDAAAAMFEAVLR